MEEGLWVGDVEEAREILKENKEIKVNRKYGPNGYTALHEACIHGQDEIVAMLLAHPDIDVNLKNNYGDTPFLLACYKGRTACVPLLLKDPRVKVNEPNDDGCTPLWYAASRGYLEVIKWWIASGRKMDLGQPGNDKNDAIGGAKNPKKEEYESEEKLARRKMRCTVVASLLERFKANPEKTKSEIRKELGIIDFLVLTPPELTREQYVAFLDGKPLPPGIPVTSSSSSSSDPTQSTQKRVGHLSASDAMEVKLFEAASDGRDEVARMILKNHPRIEVNWKNQKGFDGWTALHQACGRGRGIVVTLLLAHPGIDVNQKTDGGRTPFLTACRNGRTSCVQLLLEDPNVTTLNEPDNDGFTPLWYAAKNGHLDVIKVWIASGREMDLGEPGNDKNDAIGAAKKSGRIEVVSLLERWRDFEVRKELGITDFPVRTPPKITREQYVAFLDRKPLPSGTPVTSSSSASSDPAQSIQKLVSQLLASDTMEKELWYAANSGKESEVLKILQKNPNIDVNRKGGGYGSTPLHEACVNGLTEAVSWLLAHPNIHVNQMTDDGETPFLLACYSGRTSCVQLLLRDDRVNLNIPDILGFTPLWYAAERGHLDVIEEWIVSNREMDLGKLGSRHTDAIRVAKKKGRIAVISLLEEFEADPDRTVSELGRKRNDRAASMKEKLNDAVSDGNENEVRKILEEIPGIDINWKDSGDLSALYVACIEGHDKIVALLLAHPDVDVNQKDNDGNTPFMMACLYGRTTCVQLLLKDVRVLLNEPDDVGYTPLCYAAESGYLEVIRWWIASGRGVYLGESGNEYNDAIGVASERGKTKVVSLLERFKANPTQTRNEIRNELGITSENDKLFSQNKDEPFNEYFNRVYLFLLYLQRPLDSLYGTSFYETDTGEIRPCLLLKEGTPTFAEDKQRISEMAPTISCKTYYEDVLLRADHDSSDKKGLFQIFFSSSSPPLPASGEEIIGDDPEHPIGTLAFYSWCPGAKALVGVSAAHLAKGIGSKIVVEGRFRNKELGTVLKWKEEGTFDALCFLADQDQLSSNHSIPFGDKFVETKWPKTVWVKGRTTGVHKIPLLAPAKDEYGNVLLMSRYLASEGNDFGIDGDSGSVAIITDFPYFNPFEEVVKNAKIIGVFYAVAAEQRMENGQPVLENGKPVLDEIVPRELKFTPIWHIKREFSLRTGGFLGITSCVADPMQYREMQDTLVKAGNSAIASFQATGVSGIDQLSQMQSTMDRFKKRDGGAMIRMSATSGRV